MGDVEALNYCFSREICKQGFLQLFVDKSGRVRIKLVDSGE